MKTENRNHENMEDKRMAAYRDQIRSPEDLVSFCYNHAMVTDPDLNRDREAKETAREKAAEYGIPLEEKIEAEQIETVADLVNYCYHHSGTSYEVTEEDTVMRSRAEDFGIDLDAPFGNPLDLTEADLGFAQDPALSL